MAYQRLALAVILVTFSLLSFAQEETLRSPATDMAKLDAEFLALQNDIQMESRKYQTISNALKARHDAAMNSIRSTRA